MLIDVPSMLTAFCFVFNHFLRSRSPEQIIGSQLITLPKEAPND